MTTLVLVKQIVGACTMMVLISTLPWVKCIAGECMVTVLVITQQISCPAGSCDVTVMMTSQFDSFEVQFGNLHNVETLRRCRQERNEFGRFFYRFPDGEAGLDVYG